MSEMTVIVVTPEETVVETTASSLVLPLFDGEIGILPKHAPMIGRLGYGEMRLTAGSDQTSYYVDGGFVQVAGDEVNVMTNRAMPTSEVDATAAEELLKTSLDGTAKGDDAIAARQRVLDQARAQVRLGRKVR